MINRDKNSRKGSDGCWRGTGGEEQVLMIDLAA